MIQFVRGTLAAILEDRVIVDVNGFGMGVFLPVSSMGMLPSVGDEVKLHTYMSVKEDAMQLFGFLTKDELTVFRQLITVSGIGPKGGQGILSVLSPDDLRFAVLSGDAKAISAAPGVGKKTAEKVIIELKDKLKIEDTMNSLIDQTPEKATKAKKGKGGKQLEIQNEVIQALVALGYSQSEALKAIHKVDMTEDITVEKLLKEALRHVAF